MCHVQFLRWLTIKFLSFDFSQIFPVSVSLPLFATLLIMRASERHWVCRGTCAIVLQKAIYATNNDDDGGGGSGGGSGGGWWSMTILLFEFSVARGWPWTWTANMVFFLLIYFALQFINKFNSLSTAKWSFWQWLYRANVLFGFYYHFVVAFGKFICI